MTCSRGTSRGLTPYAEVTGCARRTLRRWLGFARNDDQGRHRGQGDDGLGVSRGHQNVSPGPGARQAAPRGRRFARRRPTAIKSRRTRRPHRLCLESKASALARSKAEALDSRRMGCGALLSGCEESAQAPWPRPTGTAQDPPAQPPAGPSRGVAEGQPGGSGSRPLAACSSRRTSVRHHRRRPRMLPDQLRIAVFSRALSHRRSQCPRPRLRGLSRLSSTPIAITDTACLRAASRWPIFGAWSAPPK